MTCIPFSNADSSPVTAPGPPDPCLLLVTVMASSLAFLPPASGLLRFTFHKLSQGILSEPLSETRGPLDKVPHVWPAVPGPAHAACPRRRPICLMGLRLATPEHSWSLHAPALFLLTTIRSLHLQDTCPLPSQVCAPWSALQGTHPPRPVTPCLLVSPGWPAAP